MKAKILLSAGMLLLVSLSVKAQNKLTVESCIDRFELRSSDLNGNGWAHYYIPKAMGDTLTVKMSCVFVGKQTHAPHTHNEDESFYIIKGPVRFHINGEERILNTGDFVYTPSGSHHNIQRIDDRDTIKYLVIKRETVNSVDRPHPVSKPEYTYDDCTTYPAAHREWTATVDARLVLLDKQFADGFQIVLERVTANHRIYQSTEPRTPGQVAFYIISGEAAVTLDGQTARIETDNTFYCPKGSTFSLQKAGNDPLLFLTVTTE